MAANLYADASNVILAGTLLMRPSFYTALTYMARGQPVETCRLPDHDVQRIMVGEHRNLLLQAICRGQARKSRWDTLSADGCLHHRVTHERDSKALEDVFPGCWFSVGHPCSKG